MNFPTRNLLLVVLGTIVGIIISSLISFLSGLTVLTIVFYGMTIFVILGLLEISRRLLLGVKENQGKEPKKLETKEKVNKLDPRKSTEQLVNNPHIDPHIEIKSELKRLKRQTRMHNKNNNQ